MLFHPIVVHFAIALLSIAVVMEFLFLLSKKENHWQLAGQMLIAGTVFAILAVITGNLAYDQVQISENVEALVHSHRDTGTIAMWGFIVLAIVRFTFIRFSLFQKPVKWVYYLLAIFAVTFLFRTGLLGGEMVYFHGVGVQQQAPPSLEKPSFEE